MVKEITLSRGKVALVSDEDYERVSQYKWYAVDWDGTGKSWYARRRFITDGVRRYVSLHRFIMGVPDSIKVDHIDGDGLNCQRYNLRHATHQQNSQNRRIGANNTSGYKGVVFVRRAKTRRWQAQIEHNCKTLYLGRFESAVEAARAYDHAARELFGEFARPNFPEAA